MKSIKSYIRKSYIRKNHIIKNHITKNPILKETRQKPLAFGAVIIALCSFAQIGYAEPTDKYVDSTGKNQVSSLRKGMALDEENPAPAKLQDESNKDIKFKRAYPMQPPPIPHKISGYQIDKKANQCMSCHARTRTEESQAPMISVTHFMDRDGNFLADVSARRYFCTQCHVSQVEREALIENDFKDVSEILPKGNDKKH